MLCDPVDRLESAYVFFRGRCEAARNCVGDGPYKHLNYAGWVREILEKYPKDIKAVGGDPSHLDSNLYHQIKMSMYAENIKAWTSVYDPSQFLVIPSYYYYEDPQSALRDIAAHVGRSTNHGHAKHANNYPEKKRLVATSPRMRRTS